MTADPLDGRLDRVHSDAASGQAGDLGGRRKAGEKNQVDDIGISHPR